jgi:hypothetical protein
VTTTTQPAASFTITVSRPLPVLRSNEVRS